MILYNFKIKTNIFSVYRQETDAATEEQSTFLAYDKRVKELAQELTESQVTEPLYCCIVHEFNFNTYKNNFKSFFE